MTDFNEALNRADTLTFDCYGTLIDWRAGIIKALAERFGYLPRERADELFAAYLRTEAAVEALPHRKYRDVLADVTRRLAREFNLELPDDRAGLLAERLPHWPPFPDTREALNELKQRFRLGVLSNIDRDLFAATVRPLGVDFDFVITAEDVGSYKPGLGHFRRLLDRHADRDRVIHVAQSLFHDGVPARTLDLAFVWINRYNDVNATDVEPLAELPDLRSLADKVSAA